MGIQKLNAFLKEYCPGSICYVPLSDFKGKNIAIDAINIVYPYYIKAYEKIVDQTDLLSEDVNDNAVTKIFIEICFNCLINKLLGFNITPIMIFDGKAPIEKKEEQDKRIEVVRKRLELYESTKKYLQEECDPLEITPTNLKDLQKLKHGTSRPTFQFRTLKEVLKLIGIPVFESIGEAERACSMFCRDGIAAAALSSDTDCYAYGCPITISKFFGNMINPETNQSEPYVTIGYMNRILEEINPGNIMKQEDFLEICIMCGCDYNKNIRLIGFKTVYDLLVRKGIRIIDNLPEMKGKLSLDQECLKKDVCRRLFKPCYANESVEDLSVPLMISNRVSDDLHDYLSKFGLEKWVRIFNNTLSKFQNPVYDNLGKNIELIINDNVQETDIVNAYENNSEEFCTIKLLPV